MSLNDARCRPESTLEDALNEARMEWPELLWRSMMNRWIGNRHQAMVEWELTKHRFHGTGPYAKDGSYDKILPGWNDYELDHRQVDWRRRTMPRSVPVITVQVAPIADAVIDS